MGECGQEHLLLFPQERTGEAGEAGEAGSGLGGLNNFSGLWSTGAVPRCLVPGCGVLLLRKKGRTDGNQLSQHSPARLPEDLTQCIQAEFT